MTSEIDEFDLKNRKVREKFNLTASCRDDGFHHSGLGIKIINLRVNHNGLVFEKNFGLYQSEVDDPDLDADDAFYYKNIAKAIKSCPVGVRTGKKQYEFVLNADSDEMASESTLPLDDFPESNVAFHRELIGRPSLSFNCASRLLDTTPRKLPQFFESGEIVLADYTKDERRPIDSSEKKKLEKEGTLTPPESGFTLMGRYLGSYEWHRSGFILLNSKSKSYLFGQDEDAYFGVELPKRVASVKKAFDVLMPKIVHGRSDYLRQGEWYILPVKETDVPPETEFVATFRSDQEYSEDGRFFSMNRDSLESAHHKIEAELVGITKTGDVYALNGTMIHENGDHVNVDWNNWAILIRNLAVRSVSVKGVD